MKRLLNERTGTLHRLRPEADAGPDSDETACGALRHVPSRCITLVATDERAGNGDGGGVGDETERCGRCFEDAGGY